MSQQAKETKARKARHFIKEWRKHRRMTQESLAEKAGMTAGAISQMENGIINYTQPSLEAIADALGTSTGSLLSGEPQMSREPLSPIDELRSALIGFGVHPDDLGRAVSSVRVFLDDDGQSSQHPDEDQIESSSRPRTPAPTGKRVPQSSS